MREEKKYEVLPGVELPDLKTIKAAASDFSISDVGDVAIREFSVETSSVAAATTAPVSTEELARLQSLGDKVAEEESRSQAESRAKMEAIKKNAIHASESISDLKTSNIQKVNEEKRQEIENSLMEDQQIKAEEAAKIQAREERRQLQQRLFEEAKARAAKEKAEAAEAESKSSVPDTSEQENGKEPDAVIELKSSDAVPDLKTAGKPVVEEKHEATIASADETFDDFKEFLDDTDSE